MLTPPFAVETDLADKPITPEVRARAETLLEDASQLILDEDTRGVLDDLTDPTPTIVRITCAVAIRAAQAEPTAGPPVTQNSWNAGPFGGSNTFIGPTGDLYLTKAEKRQLGFSRQRAGHVDMWAGAYETEA